MCTDYIELKIIKNTILSFVLYVWRRISDIIKYVCYTHKRTRLIGLIILLRVTIGTQNLISTLNINNN